MAAENTPQRGIEAAREKAMGAVTPRSVVLGLLTSAVAIATVIWAEYAQGTIQIGYLQIPPVAVGLLFLVVLLNRLAGWIWPRMRLRPAEIIVIYVMLLFSSMVASRGVGQRLWSTMVSGSRHSLGSLAAAHVDLAGVAWTGVHGVHRHGRDHVQALGR